MKKYSKILLAALGLFTFVSCEDVLDVEPTTAIEAEGSVVDFITLDRSTLGAYSALQSTNYYGLRYLLYQGLYADDISFSGTFTTDREVASKRINSSNLQIANTWSSIYTAINRANIVIRDAQRLTNISDEQRNQIIGEMKFIRGLAHFDLLKVYGGVPVVTTPTTSIEEIQLLPRATEAQVYEAIIADLQDAETKLEGITQIQRASEYAPVALLARVYLQRGNYAEAAAKATKVIESGQFELLDDFATLFTNEGNDESIFELDFTMNDANGLGTASDPTSSGQRFYVSANAYAALEASANEGDERFEATTTIQRNRRRLIKYDDVSNNADNVIVIRLAEMFLIRAEANARMASGSEAASSSVLSDINIIRERAGLMTVEDISNAEALQEILEQRRLEFVGEGLRFMDLKRYNLTCDLLEFCEDTGETFRNLWPIPLQQIEVNPGLTQNPGY
ncbi:RagB/SusD family nutrient uptake outer membrane protein [Pontibacter sp. E15-1]|uniref:RagB/SusD family nutrient uptake outer membrane protein n=1 Tax=Pontibacter sp. E15-1 TaxID=2919918 RepID=UPI001F4FE075|nr:RagB/SusD family nutrient uptake outer membrane protein [Pontibacter sp. E15-1]MCJ8164467.1 RagB/SusD family nutrient uptake outer membrane protein [Pontibacter sp. E15-1]